MNSIQRFSILASLYLAQGLPYGFFTQALPTLMREAGVDLALIGLASLLALPWALKFLWAPFFDRYSFVKGAHRRSWILISNTLAALGLLVLSLMPLNWWMGAGITWLFFLVFFMNFFAASQDISTDALAVENISADQRGWANGVQVAGYRVGMIIGGGVILSWLTVLQWQGAMKVMAVLLLASCWPVLFWQKEPEIVPHDNYRQAYKGLFIKSGFWLWLVFLAVFKFGDAFGTAMLRPMLVDHDYSLEYIAWLLGTWGVIAGLIGALLGGVLIQPLGRHRALWIFALLQAGSIGSYGFIPLLEKESDWVLVICIVEHITGGMATTALFTVMMDYCRSQHAGLDYGFQSSIVVVGGLIAATLSGISAQWLGYESHYQVALALGLVSVIMVLKIRSLLNRGLIDDDSHRQSAHPVES